MFDDIFLGAFDSSALELILLPTEQCNFRCTYCYETFDLGRMSRPTIDAVKLLISHRAPELRSLHISWFGGEPLLATDIILEVNKFSQTLLHEHFFASITTNAYGLHPVVFSELLASGTSKFQISLDGPRDQHDRTRRRIDGGPTFDRIWSNLVSTREVDRDFEIVIRIHVSSENHTQVSPLMDEILAVFSGDYRYKIFLKEISKLGGSADNTLVQLQTTARNTVVEAVRKQCAERIEFMHESDHNSVDYICYASKLNSFLIRSDGRIGKCTVALNDDENVIGQLNEDGTMRITPSVLNIWTGGLFTGERAQMECPLSFKLRQNSSHRPLP
jgi:uncharacterized protein